MATIRQWLNDEHFDWDNGSILYQETSSSAPGWAMPEEITTTYGITASHPILDQEFSSGYGSPDCPRFVAQDQWFTYFPCQYDGATWCEKVARSLDHYFSHPTPYPGS